MISEEIKDCNLDKHFKRNEEEEIKGFYEQFIHRCACKTCTFLFLKDDFMTSMS